MEAEDVCDDPAFVEMYQQILKENLCLFAKDVLGLEIGPHIVAWGELVAVERRLAVNAARDHSKCHPGDALILRADGARVRIDEWTGGTVLALNDAGKLVEAYSPASEPNGVKRVLRITTRTGRTVDVTHNHPLRKFDGWARADSLVVGDRIAAPRVLPVEGVAEVRAAWLLGLLVGDGCLQTGARVSIGDEKVAAAARESAEAEGWTFRPVGNAPCAYGIGNEWCREGSPIAWLREHGLLGTGSRSKRVPAQVFSATRAAIADFLAGYFDADGCVNPHGGGSLYYVSVNRPLLEDVQHLLLRFGVVSVISPIRRTYKGAPHESWMLCIRGGDILRFAQHVTLRGSRAEQLAALVHTQEAKAECSGRTVDSFPPGVWKHVQHSRHWFERQGFTRPGGRGAPTRDRVERVAVAEQNEALLRIAQSDVLWDEIADIHDIGEHETWALCVPGLENYVADDIINHNSTFFSYAYPIWRAWSEPGCEVYIFSKTLEQATEFLDIVLYGRNNLKGVVDIPQLAHLMPSREAMKRDPSLRLNKADVKFTNGSRIRVAGYGKAMRGRHPKYVVLDDPLNDEDMWSETTRRKNIEYFKSAITNMVTPEGQLIVVGCVTEDTVVPTATGLRRIGDLRPGPRVAQTLSELNLPVHGRDGMRNASHFWDNGTCATKRVTLESGHSIEGSLRHPLLTMGSLGNPIWSSLPDIRVGDWVAVKTGTECWGPSPEGLDVDMAYLMGLWTAEGSVEGRRGTSYRLTVANTDTEIHQFLSNRSEKWVPHRGGTHWRCSNRSFLSQWEKWGVEWTTAGHKRIPPSILSGSRENAVAWLQGYLDGDGNAYSKGKITQVSAGSISKGLIDDLQLLLGNLGVFTRQFSKPSPPTKRAPNGGQTLYMIRALGDDARRVMKWGFRLTRKQRDEQLSGQCHGVPNQRALIRAAMDSKPRKPRSVDGVREKPPFNVTEILKSETVRSDSLRSVSEWYRRWGAAPEVCDLMAQNASEDLRWVRVANVEDSEAYTVDFVVPDGHSFISNGIVSHNTPYHASDLYGFLRKNEMYSFIRFPGIIKDPKTGEDRALFPWRWSLKKLYDKKKEIGSVSFAREILCQPISDDLSIFPGDLFPPCYAPHLTMRPKLAEIRTRKWITYMGIDIARSSSVGADYFVIFVIAKDSEGNQIILDIRRSRGLPFQAQLKEIEIAAALYDPTLILIESNAMQQIYTDEMRRTTDLPVKEFVTHATNKYPLDKGVPSLRIALEGGKVVIPKGDEISRRLSEIWEDECQQFGFIDGKLQGIGEHDDTVMAWWFAVEASKLGGFSFSFGDGDDDDDDEDEDGAGWEDVMLGEPDPTDADFGQVDS